MPRITKYDREIALERAVGLFWARGYAAASMKQIEHALDMRPGSIYAAFGSKEGLYSEALELYLQGMFKDLDEHLAQHSSITAGLQDLFRKVAASYLSDAEPPSRACMLVKALLELNDTQPGLHQRINEIFERIEERFAMILEEARAMGDTRADLDCPRMARLLQAQMMGLRSFAQRQVPPEHARALAEDIASFLDSQWRRRDAVEPTGDQESSA